MMYQQRPSKWLVFIIYTGPEPTVRPVRFWPDHFLLGARPLLVKCLGLAFAMKPVELNALIINTSLEKKISFQCFVCFVLLKILIFTGSLARRGYMVRYVAI